MQRLGQFGHITISITFKLSIGLDQIILSSFYRTPHSCFPVEVRNNLDGSFSTRSRCGFSFAPKTTTTCDGFAAKAWFTHLQRRGSPSISRAVSSCPCDWMNQPLKQLFLYSSVMVVRMLNNYLLISCPTFLPRRQSPQIVSHLLRIPMALHIQLLAAHIPKEFCPFPYQRP